MTPNYRMVPPVYGFPMGALGCFPTLRNGNRTVALDTLLTVIHRLPQPPPLGLVLLRPSEFRVESVSHDRYSNFCRRAVT